MDIQNQMQYARALQEYLAANQERLNYGCFPLKNNSPLQRLVRLYLGTNQRGSSKKFSVGTHTYSVWQDQGASQLYQMIHMPKRKPKVVYQQGRIEDVLKNLFPSGYKLSLDKFFEKLDRTGRREEFDSLQRENQEQFDGDSWPILLEFRDHFFTIDFVKGQVLLKRTYS